MNKEFLIFLFTFNEPLAFTSQGLVYASDSLVRVSRQVRRSHFNLIRRSSALIQAMVLSSGKREGRRSSCLGSSDAAQFQRQPGRGTVNKAIDRSTSSWPSPSGQPHDGRRGNYGIGAPGRCLEKWALSKSTYACLLAGTRTQAQATKKTQVAF